MKNHSLLILFFFGILLECAYSVSPKKDKIYEVPVIKPNRRKTKIRQVPQQTFKIGYFRYFLFRLKDLYKASDGIYPDYLFFQLNSTYMKNFISYALVNKKVSRISENYDFNKLIYYSPNITYRQYIRHVKVSNHMAIYAKRTDDRRRETLIIKVNENRNETLELKPLSSLPKELKTQFYDMINSRKITTTTKKDYWRHNHNHDSTDRMSSSYDYNRNYYSRKKYRFRLGGFWWFGMTIYFIGFIIIIAYILVNRRKRSFTNVLKNPVVPINNQNV